ncbi:hypothetical protein KW785_00395 [Candidatus Parcubacteria bacterium]|nr:hypothetical protein [Candidatus Parcubacteria bacterium]
MNQIIAFMKKSPLIASLALLVLLVAIISVFKPLTRNSPQSKTASVNLSYSGFAGPAELPRAYVDTTMPSQSGQTINVASGGNLQAALDTAQPGDTIVLQAGATYTGNFILRNKSNPNNQWIVIKSNGTLPPEGRRVTPANAGQLAKLQTGVNYANAVATQPGANYYRLIGLEITTAPQLIDVNTILAMGTSDGAVQNTLASIPHHIVVDRSYVHGYDTLQNRRCIGLNSAWSAVIDSYVSQCEGAGYDTQAIAGGNGPGPYKIVNNFLEASSEDIAFGGFDPAIQGMLPNDMEIRGNHFFRPLTWRSGTSIYDGVPRLEKNVIEFKIGKRLLMEGNVLENAWNDAQVGWGFTLWSVNQNGGCTWCETSDVVIRNNILKNVASPFGLSGVYGVAVPMSRLYIANNIDYGRNADNPGWREFSIAGVSNITAVHNTMLIHGESFMIPDSAIPSANLIFQDNVIGDGYYGITNAVGSGIKGLDSATNKSWTFDHNVFLLSKNDQDSTWLFPYPANNSYPVTLADIGFVSSTDFHLSSNSPYKGKASDGSDPGADIDAVLYATRGAVSGDWSGSISLPPPPPTTGDTTAPSVSVTTPVAGTTLVGTATLIATASDNVGVVGVQFKVDGVNVDTEKTIPPYTASWNTTAGSDGSHIITAVARDAAGNSTVSQSVSVLVSNTTGTPTTPPPTTTLQVGDWIQLTQKTNIRSTPATGGKPAGSQSASAVGQITAGPTQGSGYTWYNVDFTTGTDGWAIGDSMVKTQAPIPLAIGSSVSTTERLTVRSTPSTSGLKLGSQNAGAIGTITAGPTQADGYTWWQVDFSSGADGWVVDSLR